MEDEQAVEDLELRVALSYSTSFSHDGGQLLPLDTRLRLAARADSLEFVEAVDQVGRRCRWGWTLRERRHAWLQCRRR